MGSGCSAKTGVDVSICTTTSGFFFDEKVAISNANAVLSSLESTAAAFDEFATYSITDIEKTIMEEPSWSCSLDPLSNNVLNDFLPEIMPFEADIALHATSK